VSLRLPELLKGFEPFLLESLDALERGREYCRRNHERTQRLSAPGVIFNPRQVAEQRREKLRRPSKPSCLLPSSSAHFPFCSSGRFLLLPTQAHPNTLPKLSCWVYRTCRGRIKTLIKSHPNPSVSALPSQRPSFSAIHSFRSHCIAAHYHSLVEFILRPFVQQRSQKPIVLSILAL